MNLKGTKTEENIKTALFGESLARNKYSYFAAKARSEGEYEIAEFFDKMGGNEMTHAKAWYNYLFGEVGNTEQNLLNAASGENSEWTGMYPEFAKTAREEAS